MSRRWLDAALAAAAMMQATDDALNRTSSALVIAAGSAASRTDLAGRSVAGGLRVVNRVVALSHPALWRRQGTIDHWRGALAGLAINSAGLALLERDQAGEPQREHAVRQAVATATTVDHLPARIRLAVTRVPSSFCAFDQHHDDVTALVRKLADREPDRSRPVLVVGVRTSGSYLAPFAAAALQRAGFSDVGMVSARPHQRPVRADAHRLRAAARNGALVVVVDDPPTTGGAVATACADLMRHGIASSAIVVALALFDETPTLPARLSGFASVLLPWMEWSIHRRLEPEQVTHDLGRALAPAGVEILGELPLPPDPPRTHVKKLYRVAVTHPDGRSERLVVQAAGTGLGYFGEHDVAVAAALRGRVTKVLSCSDGVICTEWPGEGHHLAPSASDVAEYIVARHHALPLDEDVSAELRGSQPVWEVASNHLSRAYGAFWGIARVAFVDRLTRRLLQTTAPSLPDGNMRTSTWLIDPADHRPVKSGFAERAFSNYDLVCVDDRFDVVGAAVDVAEPKFARGLTRAYETRSARRISPERWLAYELVHLWDIERLGFSDAEAVSNRKSQAIRRYLAEILLRGAVFLSEGPVVALDVDGVLETDILGFKAPTPTSVLSIRALHAHGYRPVVVTGRCLEDAVEMTNLYGLAGAVAEYGSVIYTRRSAVTTPLVGEHTGELLDGFRAQLLRTPAVRVDERHRHSVRASSVDGRGQLGPLRPAEEFVVPSGLTPVVGDGQTDFIGSEVDKARGARALLEELGEHRPVLAVGDTTADVPLLTWAVRSVVPRHADASARAAATRVSRHPYQAGLEDAVAELIGHRPGACAECSPGALSAESRLLLRLLRVSEGSRLQGLLRTGPVVRELARPIAKP